MIILTDDQAAKVRDFISCVSDWWPEENTIDVDEALAILDGAQSVEVVGVTKHLHELNDEWAQELNIGTLLYAVKETK